MNNKPKIALCGGGTGGHVAPALALAEEFAARYGKESVLFLCGGNDLEREMIGGAGFTFEALPIARPGGGIVRKTKSLASIAPALWAARNALKRFGASGVIGVGGYASLPGALAARWLKLPVALLEANAVPGRVTRWLSRIAQHCYAHLPLLTPLRCQTTVMGNPLRAQFRNAPGKSAARAKLGLEPNLPTLLVMGGSQGAQALNRVLFEALPLLNARAAHMQILHIAGRSEHARSGELLGLSRIPHACAAFTSEPEIWMAAADLAVCRAGAGTISELLALGVPSLLAPFPHAADDHQNANARYVAACGAAIVVPENELQAPHLVDLVKTYLINDLRRVPLALAARRLSRPTAAHEITDACLQIFGFKQAPSIADNSQRAAA